jgi:hypothetical protein
MANLGVLDLFAREGGGCMGTTPYALLPLQLCLKTCKSLIVGHRAHGGLLQAIVCPSLYRQIQISIQSTDLLQRCLWGRPAGGHPARPLPQSGPPWALCLHRVEKVLRV